MGKYQTRILLIMYLPQWGYATRVLNKRVFALMPCRCWLSYKQGLDRISLLFDMPMAEWAKGLQLVAVQYGDALAFYAYRPRFCQFGHGSE